METYSETVRINENADIIKELNKALQRWDLDIAPSYIGNNFEVYSSKDKQVEIVLKHDTREVTTSYKA